MKSGSVVMVNDYNQNLVTFTSHDRWSVRLDFQSTNLKILFLVTHFFLHIMFEVKLQKMKYKTECWVIYRFIEIYQNMIKAVLKLVPGRKLKQERILVAYISQFYKTVDQL